MLELDRALVRAVASGIAVATENFDRADRRAARDVFFAVFLRPGQQLGTTLCWSTYRRALREVRSARRRGDRRALHRLAGTYDTLVRLGVPAEVVSTTGAASIPGRLQLELSGRDPQVPQNILDVDPADFALDLRRNTWWERLKTGGWSGAMPNQSFQSLLVQLGLQRKQIDNFISRADRFHTQAPVFDAGDELVTRAGTRVMNTYVPAELRPEPGPWRDIHQVLRSLANGDPVFIEYLLDWLAMQAQALNLGYVRRVGERPPPKPVKTALRTQVAVVLHGREGTGKGTLYEIMRVILGASNCVTLSQNDLDGRFSSQIKHKLFVNANEVMSSTNRFAETANKLKAWITDAEIAIEEKNRPAENVANYCNLMIGSNDDAPVLISATDRRYTVKKSTHTLDKAVAARVYADLAGPRRQVAAFFDYLLRRQVSIRVGEIFESADRAEIQRLTAPSEDKFFHEVAEDGWFAVAAPWVEAAPTFQSRSACEDGFVPSATLQDVYNAFCRRNNLKPCGKTKLTNALKKIIRTARPHSPRIGGIRTRGWLGIPMHPPGDAPTGGAVVPLPVPPRPGSADNVEFAVEAP